MNLFLIIIFCVISALIAVLLRQVKSEYSVMITVVAVCVTAGLVITQLSVIIDFINSVFKLTSVSSEYIKILLKATGICYISHIGSSICKECNQMGLSQQIETAAKLMILLIALPIFTELLDLASGLSSV